MPPLLSAFDQPMIEKDSGRRGGHGNFTTSFRLRFLGNPILIDRDDEEWYTKSESQSAQYSILNDDRLHETKLNCNLALASPSGWRDTVLAG